MIEDNEEEIVEILDEEIILETRVTAREIYGIDSEGLVETPGLGFYIGDGIYV